MFGIFKNRISGILSKRPASVMVVELSSDIKLLNVGLGDRPEINALKILELPSDKREEVILEALRNFIKENNISHKNAILVPSLSSLLIKRLQLPVVLDEELPETLKWQIKDEINYEVSGAILDYQVIRKTTKEDGAQVLDVICVVAQQEEIKKQVLLLKQLGLSCLAVSILPFGYTKLIEKYLKPETEEATGVLHLGENACFIAFYKNNKLDFYRELPVSINKLRESLTSALVSDTGTVQLTSDEIEEVLFKNGIPLDSSVYKSKMPANQILAMLRPVLERLTQEIRRSITYYDTQFRGGQIKKIWLGAKAPNMPNLDKFLGSELSLDFSIISLRDRIETSSDINSESLSQSSANLGLSLDFEKGINLLPQEFRTEKIEMIEIVSVRWIFIIVFSLLVVSFLFAKATNGIYQRRLDNALIHRNVLLQVQEPKVKIDALSGFIAGVRNQDVPTGEILKKLSNIAPADLFFENLEINCESKSGKIIGFIKGTNYNPDALLSQFMSGMNNSTYFKDISVSSVEQASLEGAGVTKFQISFKLQ